MTQYRTEKGRAGERERKRREAERLRRKNSTLCKHVERLKVRDGPNGKAKCPDCREAVIFDIDRHTRLVEIDPVTREPHVCR